MIKLPLRFRPREVKKFTGNEPIKAKNLSTLSDQQIKEILPVSFT